MSLALVLTGGGARAAYQVGAIQALSEILSDHENPFGVMTGVSAGAINASYLAARAGKFSSSTKGLWDLWAHLDSEKVYRADVGSLTSLGSKWLSSVSLGGITKQANYLLDTQPLRELLQREVPLEQIPLLIKQGKLRGFSVSATNYLSGTAISFYDGVPEIRGWIRSTRMGLRVPLTVEHIMASSAIPVFFPPIEMDGSFYGDGCIRLSSPLSPSIHLGAEKIIAIGIRYFRTQEQTIEINREAKQKEISIADISGVLLNAVFLDSLETDLERLERINSTLGLLTPEQKQNMSNPLRKIPVLTLRPSQDLGRLAQGSLKEFPTLVRYLLRGIGAKENKGWDLLSYLAFEKKYTHQLLDLGYSDTLRRRDEILRFTE